MAFSLSCVVIDILMSSVTILYIFYYCRLTNFISLYLEALVTAKVIDSYIPATCTWLTLMKIIKLCRKQKD